MHLKKLFLLIITAIFFQQISYAEVTSDKTRNSLATSPEIHGPQKVEIEASFPNAKICQLEAELKKLNKRKLEIANRYWKLRRGIESGPHISFEVWKMAEFDSERKRLAEQLLLENLDKINEEIKTKLEKIERIITQLKSEDPTVSSSAQ